MRRVRIAAFAPSTVLAVAMTAGAALSQSVPPGQKAPGAAAPATSAPIAPKAPDTRIADPKTPSQSAPATTSGPKAVIRSAAPSIPAPMAAAPANAASAAPNADILDVAAAKASLSTLVAAIKAAGLAETMKGAGPLTLLAPTDEAFKKLAPGTLDTLLKPEMKAALATVLSYHVLPGRYDAQRLQRPKALQFGVRSLEGQALEFDRRGGGLKVSGAAVTATDVAARNGVIHIIDTVLLPRAVARALAVGPARRN